MPTPEIAALVEAVCDEAYAVLEAATSSITPAEAHEIRRQISNRVMAAVGDGERDPQVLMDVALNLKQALLLAFLFLPSSEFLSVILTV